MARDGFLDGHETEKFAASHVSRHCVPSERQGEKTRVVGMGPIIKTALARGGGLFVDQKVVGINGKERHGLTWAAQEALEEVGKAEPSWKRTVALDGRNGAGTVVALAGWKPAYRALRSSGVKVGGACALRGIALVAALAAWGALSAAALLAAGPETLFSGRPAVLEAASVPCAIAWWLVSRAVRARMSGRLARSLADPGLSEDAVGAVGRAVGPRLVGEEVFTVFVVDGYSRLPAPVRAGILEALRRGRLSHAVTWIIFDAAPFGLLRKDLAQLRQSGGQGFAVASYDLEHLSPDERARIAEANGIRPEHARCDDDLFAALPATRAAEGRQGSDGPRTPFAA